MSSNQLDTYKKLTDSLTFPPQAHHFTFSIDLRSIRDHHSTNTINIFLRYMYPFFGSAAPILTHPTVEIRKGSEVLLPQSFCAFDFACSMQQLQETFARVPLVVEVWHRDRHLSQDVLVGTVKLPLSLVMSAGRTRIMNSAGASGWRQEASDRVPVTSSDGKLEKCADISLVLSLEDWGPIASGHTCQQNSRAPNIQALPFQTESSTGVESVETGTSSPRHSAEYQAAVELELWKENQEKDFERKMKIKETTLMKTLAEEWKKRDTEREVLTQRKLTEFKQMEDQLRKTLTDLERREKKLAVSEHEVMKLRSDLQREHDRKLMEMKEASRRLKEDCDHQVELQKMKMKELEDTTNRHKQDLGDSERKYKTLETEFATYRDRQTKTPEVRLQSEVNLLNMEKMELDRKLDAATKSKIYYKQQWGRALKELARLKQKEQELAKANLLHQKQELEHMRLRYLAAEEKEVVSKDNKELEEIRSQISKLKQREEERLQNMSDSHQIPLIKDAYGKPLNLDLDASVDEHVVRLVEERDTLLRTGVYTTQDKIIAELDRQIRETVSHRTS
uniref:C2 domain-containing protein n=2 Tax=Arion vulgaris TaxID=1028688 RepID=A0A0B6ZYD3_9EUPU